ncbi:MAG TPA: ABC transporter ATP-binding protein [Chthonomonadales bacterium]|nr:ABC transporter ATP-binding protein [Chthonomonadales bacterium]
MAVALSIQGLTKKYLDVWNKEEITAVDDLTLEVEEGEIFGFLGRNGAGKTTTIKMLLGLIFPTSGTASVLGKPMGDTEAKSQLSYLPENPYFYENMSGWDVLDFYGRLFRMGEPTRTQRIEKCLNDVRLDKRAWRRPLRGYSKGMLQRIGIAQSLLNDPKLLFLDEPTSGLDPIAHAELRDIIRDVGKQGKTVFLSSHQLPDVELVCNRAAIIHRGKLLTSGPLSELTSGDKVEVLAESVPDDAVEQIRALCPAVERSNGRVRVTAVDPGQVNDIVDIVRGRKGSVTAVLPHKRTLEEVFVDTVLRAGGD